MRLFHPLDLLKSVNSNFTVAVRSQIFGQAKTQFFVMFGKKGEKIWPGRDWNPQSVDQKLIVLTITP